MATSPRRGGSGVESAGLADGRPAFVQAGVLLIAEGDLDGALAVHPPPCVARDTARAMSEENVEIALASLEDFMNGGAQIRPCGMTTAFSRT